MDKVKIAMIGVGAISAIYLKNLTNVFREVEVIGIYDLVTDRAESAAAEYSIAKVYKNIEEAFEDDDVDIILNLTRPCDHFSVTSRALNAGKNVYSEKPLAATYEEGKILVELAEEKGLMLGSAPDTFLGSAIQTCKKLIDDGYIGDIVGSACFLICHGHETWHPAPEFYYKHGGGPMMDMGPYYITALINMIGGVKGLIGASKKTFETRTITSKPKCGETIDVEVPTHVTGTLFFENGAIGTIITTFDVYSNEKSRFEIYGTKGTLSVPNPDFFGGEIKLLRPEDGIYKTMPCLFDYKEDSRGLGLADMAKALQTGRECRVNARQALHVLEIITSFDKSSEDKKYIELEQKYVQTIPMKNNKIHGILD